MWTMLMVSVVTMMLATMFVLIIRLFVVFFFFLLFKRSLVHVWHVQARMLLSMVQVHLKCLFYAMLELQIFSMRVLRLHFEHEVTATRVNILRMERACVRLKASSSLMPLTAVK